MDYWCLGSHIPCVPLNLSTKGFPPNCFKQLFNSHKAAFPTETLIRNKGEFTLSDNVGRSSLLLNALGPKEPRVNLVICGWIHLLFKIKYIG